MTDLVLHQFVYSHFNDKVRWALDRKQLDHRRVTYLPGPHAPAIRRLSGQTQTPVLVVDGHALSGSAAIIDRLEQLHPPPALYPQDAAARAEALRWQARLDAELGPAARTVLFSALIREPDYLCQFFAEGKPAMKRFFYRRSFPLARALMARGNGVNPEGVRRASATAAVWLDRVAAAVSETGYCVGDTFSVADLTAATLLAPLGKPLSPDMCRPEPMPGAVEDLLGQFAHHPAIIWMQHMYQHHRSSAVAVQSVVAA